MACPPPEFDWSSWATWSCLREDIAPIATFVGAAIVAWAALAQARTARQRHEEQTKADRERRITESFAKAVEQLGSEKLETRLGAIYTFERLSRESEREYWPIMETLTAYVRENAPWPPRSFHPFMQLPGSEMADVAKESSSSDGPEDQEKEIELPTERIRPATDVQAILTVIGRREKGTTRLIWRLAESILSRIQRLRLEFMLRNVEGKEQGIAQLIYRLAEHVLLRICPPKGDNQRIDLSETDLRGANLEGAYLEGASLEGANLKDAWLKGANLEHAWLHDANLEDANLKKANLEHAWLGEVNLEGAFLDTANLKCAWLEEAKLKDAWLDGANLKGAWELTQEQINSAGGDETTVLPEYLKSKRPAHWTES